MEHSKAGRRPGRADDASLQGPEADFSRTRELTGELLVLPYAGSTNDEAAARVGAGGLRAPFSTVVTLDQRAGHGRLGRSWSCPPGGALAASVVVRLKDPAGAALLPLVAGTAMAAALRELGVPAAVKWPNDVLVGGAKICGILCLLAAPGTVIVGSGINLRLTPEETAHLGLHGARATAVNLEGCTASPDTVLSAYLAQLRHGVEILERDPADAVAAARTCCETLGTRVRIELPDGGSVIGRAVDLRDDGAIFVRADGEIRAFVAGDVTHLRPAVG